MSPSTKVTFGGAFDRPRSISSGTELDRHDLPYERRQRERPGAGAGPGIEGSLVAGQRHEVADARGELVRAALLQRGEPISRRCEPSPHCVVRTQVLPPSS
jgi:hypothetical protein